MSASPASVAADHPGSIAPHIGILVVTPAQLRSGGLGTAVAEFVDGAEALGHEPRHVGSTPEGPLRRIVNSRPLRRACGTGPARRLGARALRRAVPRSGWDLAYATPGSAPVEQGGVCVIHQSTRHPALEWAALHRAEGETGGRGDLSRAERRRREHEIERADLVHVTSLAVRDEFLEAGFAAERLVHAPLGVDLQRFSVGEKATQPTIAFVGPLSLRKGVDTVAELAARLRGRAAVRTVGGPSCPWSRRIAERADFQPWQSVPDALASAHLLVLPSRSDGFSYVALEALASGTVPIVTPQVGAAEIVRELDPRLVVERVDFVEATEALLEELDLAAMASRARALAERFDRRHTSQAIARGVLDRAAPLLTKDRPAGHR